MKIKEVREIIRGAGYIRSPKKKLLLRNFNSIQFCAFSAKPHNA